MKKLGFTLAEVIVALGVIGLIAAVSAPLIGGIIPDQNKILVLKAYKTITDINNDLLNDSSLYLEENCTGFDCTAQPLNIKYAANSFSGTSKYRLLFQAQLETKDEDNNAFSTPDGIIWEIDDSTRDITIDVDQSSNGGDCTFGSSSCKKVDSFIFNITNTGQVRGGDALTRAYLANPHKLNDKKHDYKVAKTESSTKKTTKK